MVFFKMLPSTSGSKWHIQIWAAIIFSRFWFWSHCPFTWACWQTYMLRCFWYDLLHLASFCYDFAIFRPIFFKKCPNLPKFHWNSEEKLPKSKFSHFRNFLNLPKSGVIYLIKNRSAPKSLLYRGFLLYLLLLYRGLTVFAMS